MSDAYLSRLYWEYISLLKLLLTLSLYTIDSSLSCFPTLFSCHLPEDNALILLHVFIYKCNRYKSQVTTFGCLKYSCIWNINLHIKNVLNSLLNSMSWGIQNEKSISKISMIVTWSFAHIYVYLYIQD
jgi:hypothetical protein